MLNLALEQQNNEKTIMCNFINKIYINLYKKIRYKKYLDNCVWTLKL